MEENRMKVLYSISTYYDFVNPTSGSERQTLGMARAFSMRKNFVQLTNLLRGSPDWEKDFDLIHMVNASGEKGPYSLAMDCAKLKKIPVVLSPVFWPLDEVEEGVRSSLGEKRWNLQHRVYLQYLADMKIIFNKADLLIPNAEVEMVKINEFLGDERPYKVVPNAIDMDEVTTCLENDFEFPKNISKALKERFVVCVGRIEVRKNQYRVFQAMKRIWRNDPDLQLVLIGQGSKSYMMMFEEQLKGENVLSLGPTDHTAVMQMVKRSQAHILASFIETPGLVNLEAAALGVPIVVSSRGSISEYFGDEAFYCDPNSPRSIAKAIEGAISSPKEQTSKLQLRVQADYNYSRVAEMLEEIYRGLI